MWVEPFLSNIIEIRITHFSLCSVSTYQLSFFRLKESFFCAGLAWNQSYVPHLARTQRVDVITVTQNCLFKHPHAYVKVFTGDPTLLYRKTNLFSSFWTFSPFSGQSFSSRWVGLISATNKEWNVTVWEFWHGITFLLFYLVDRIELFLCGRYVFV